MSILVSLDGLQMGPGNNARIAYQKSGQHFAAVYTSQRLALAYGARGEVGVIKTARCAHDVSTLILKRAVETGCAITKA